MKREFVFASDARLPFREVTSLDLDSARSRVRASSERDSHRAIRCFAMLDDY